ncbi:putative RNA-binding protein EEED8.10 [Amphiura filiformis]|uniref:putative RNA-binding protein EEED8.10 n=1 Tax=Amphiura filiformis TaxID=82378 RepID=UPI003B223B63
MFSLIAVVGEGVLLLQRYFTNTEDNNPRQENLLTEAKEKPTDNTDGLGKINLKAVLGTEEVHVEEALSKGELNLAAAHRNQKYKDDVENNGHEMDKLLDSTSLESTKEDDSNKTKTSFASIQQHDAYNDSNKDSSKQSAGYPSDGPSVASSFGKGFGFATFAENNVSSSGQSRVTRMGRQEIGGNEAKIMVKNIPFKVKMPELRRFFGSFGKVVDVYLLQEHLQHKSRSKGMAFVTFRTPEEVKRVMAATEQELTLRERVLRIEYAEPRNNKQLSKAQKYNLDSKNKKQEQFEDACDRELFTTTYDVSEDDAVIHKLYDEILIKIFVLLDLKDRLVVERVCKRWYNVAKASWQSVEYLTFTNIFKGLKFATGDSSSPVGLTDEIFRSILLRGCRNLRSLDLSSSPHLLTYRSIELIGKRCTRLENINLTGVSIINKTLQQLSQSCNKLKKLILQRCLGVGEKGFWWLFHNCPMLEYIDIRESKRFRGKCFHILNQSCHTVIASGCSRLDDASIYELTAKCTTHLKCLDLSYCYHITDKSLRLLAQHCTQLNKLDLSGLVQTVSPTGLCSLSHLTELVELRLSQNAAVNDEVLVKVGQNCKQLRLIDVSGCYDGVHDAGLQGLAGCVQLEIININYLDQISDEGLKHLANSCNQLKKITARGCVLLTDEGMFHLANQCSLLQEVDVSGCEKLTNAMLDSFLLSRQNVEEENANLYLTVGGTDIEADYAKQVEQSSDGRLSIATYNLALAIKRFCTEAFFGSDDVSDDDEDAEEAVAAAEEMWPDEFMGLPPEQFADADAQMEQFNFANPLPAIEERWDAGEDFVNDYLDADDPSMWEEEEWMLS